MKDKYIITQRVLNQDTGELESQDLRVIKTKEPKARGGFRMTYCKYDDIQVKIISGKKDMMIFHSIKDCFTYSQVEVTFNKDKKEFIAKYSDCSVRAVEKMIKKMVNENFLGKISRGVYRMNPFVFIPFGCKARKLQDEWYETFDQTMEEVIKNIKDKK